MNQAEVMDMNAKARQRKKEFQVDHVEIHPEKNAAGKIVKGGGHTVRTILREKGDEYGSRREAQKPFGAGDHEAMLAHVANELKLPDPSDGDGEEKDGKEEKGAEGAAY